ncbi:MAG TPA: hypothetical protein VGP07_07180 [Polyangia bacterium]|jgi:hypothetical protein
MLCLALGLLSRTAFSEPKPGGGDPSSLKVKVYAAYASLSAQCTDPIQIFSNTSGTFVDFLSGPTLGGGDLDDGTYNCVIIKMSSIIKHTPKTTDSTCVAGTEYTGGVCNTSDLATDLDNAPITCLGDGSNAGSVDNTVYMYLTTDSAASLGNSAFVHPVAPGDGNGIKLGSPLVISATTRAKFVVNANGGVVAGGGECGINPPAFDFVNL